MTPSPIPVSNRMERVRHLVVRLHESVVGRVVAGMLLSALVLICKISLLEPLPAYSQIRLATYDAIQGVLARLTRAENSRVALVDISEIAVESGARVSSGGAAVSRKALLAALRRVADAGPVALGVDVDFSPESVPGHPELGANPVTLDDEAFFNECRRMTHEGTPIYLGVHRQASGIPSSWLGRSAFQDLAAGIYIPNARTQAELGELHKEPTKVLHMFRWARINDGDAHLESIASRLANREAFQMRRDSGSLSWALETGADFRPTSDFQAQSYLVDFRGLDRFEHEVTPLAALEAAEASRWKGKLVIFGNVGKPGELDTFEVPGREGRFAGSLIHACATDSLIRKPLVAWTPLGRIASDLVLALVGIFAAEALGALLRHRSKVHRHSEWPHISVALASAIFVLLVTLPLVARLRLIWDDSVFVALGVLVHTVLDLAVGRLAHRWHAKEPVEGEAELPTVPDPVKSHDS